MSQFDKSWEKFNRVPIPKDITFDELRYIVEHFGMTLGSGGGGHALGVRFPSLGIRIPIPKHGKFVEPAYIKQVKDAICEIQNLNK